MNILINVIGTIVLCFSLGLFIVTIIMFTHEILVGYSEDDEGEDAIDKLIKVVGVVAFCSLIAMLSVFVGVFIHEFWTDDSDDGGDTIVFDEKESRAFVFEEVIGIPLEDPDKLIHTGEGITELSNLIKKEGK